MSNVTLLAALKGLAATFTDCAVIWPNEAFVPPVGDLGNALPFVWAEITGLGSELLGTGLQNLGVQHGFCRFHVMVPTNTAMEWPYGIADTLSGLYKAKNPITGLQTYEPTAPETGATSDDGNYWGISISIPWDYWS